MGQIDLSELALTDNSLVTVQDINDLKQLRVTGLVRFAECPRRWMTEMMGLTDFDADQDGVTQADKGKYARIGTAAHQVIEHFLSPHWKHTQDVEWAVAHCMRAGMPPNERQNLIGYLQMLGNGRWTSRVAVTELKLEGSPHPDALPIGGTLDYIGFHEEDDCWDILDHKTNRTMESAEEWAEKLQPRFYTWLLRQYLREQGELNKPIRYSIGYVNCGSFVQWITDPSWDGEVSDIYGRLWRQFRVYTETGEWPERLNKYCYSCPALKTCRTAQKSMEDLAELGEEMTDNNVSLLVQHEFYTAVGKLAEALREEVRMAIKAKMGEGGAEVLKEGVFTATLRRGSRRAADFWEVFDLLVGSLSTEEKVSLAREAGDLFRVNLGALDKFAAAHPQLALALVNIIRTEENEEPTLTVRTSATK